MKELKNEEATINHRHAKNFSDKDSTETNTLSSKKTHEKGDDESKKDGEVYIRSGHGHDYSTPVAGEDGSTEDQSGDNNTEMSQPAEQGKTPGESSTI